MEAKKNEDGTWTVVLGNPQVRSENHFVFDEQLLSEELVRLNIRAKRGALCAELGFPRAKPGMPLEEHMRRLLVIEYGNVCARLSDVRLESFDERNPVIMATVRPVGPHGDFLRKQMEEGGSGLYFGIRAFSEDSMADGQPRRRIKQILNFDLVSE